MAKAKMEKKSNVFLGLGIILLVLAGIFYLRGRKTGIQLPLKLEETLVQQEGGVRKSGEEVEVLSEAELAQVKAEVDGVLEVSGEMVILEDQTGAGMAGEAKRAFSDGKFYFRMETSGLMLPEKGYFYEGWLQQESNYLSLGRMEVSAAGTGRLYYTASEDKSLYDQVLLTLEPEDGNQAPAKVMMWAIFE
jgi:hypothetical protein